MRNIGEKCAVFGIYGKGLDVGRLTFFALYALQHRGQESSGIATTDGKNIYCYKRNGLVAQVFNEEIIRSLFGHCAIGHNRYSTSAGSDVKHAQPIEVDDHSIVLAHNGNLPTLKLLIKFLKSRGVTLTDISDSKIITEALHVLIKDGMKIEKAVEKIFPLMTGSFSILIMTKDKLVAVRDQYGIRPLSIGKINGGYVFASETCAFHPIGADDLGEVKPGEMVVVDSKGMHRKKIVKSKQKLDIFEFVYFARPDSLLLGQSVYEVRKRFGLELAHEHSISADVVIPVPETAIPVAIGYASETGLPFETGIIKSRYINRTFIEPEQHIREQGVKLKLAPLHGVIDGKRVVVIDDSIVRGTTSRQIVKMLFEAGAKEVHFLVSSAPVKFPDFYGLDLPRQSDLLAAHKTIAQMCAHIGATSLNFLSYKGMIRATGLDESLLCTSCFNGVYPINIGERKKEIKYKT